MGSNIIGLVKTLRGRKRSSKIEDFVNHALKMGVYLRS